MSRINVGFVRGEIKKKLEQWRVIRDCLDGEIAIKEKGTLYLPNPSTDCNGNNSEIYESYKKRAVFLNVVRRTLYELLAQVYIKTPIINVGNSPIMDKILNNTSGDGVSLIQTSKKALNYVLSYAYSGLLVDFPDVGNKVLSKKDLDDFIYRPVINVYSPFEIVNFRVEDFGAEERLTLVVLKESYAQFQSDGFEIKNKPQYRVLKLVNGVYIQEIYRSSHNKQSNDVTSNILNSIDKSGVFEIGLTDFELYKTITPRDIDGNTLNTIPFMFIGLENNNPYPDNPVMYDLASLNLAHYRNSADYEESLFITGQATLFISGLKTEENLAGGKVRQEEIKLGARKAVITEVGGTGTFLQAKSDMALKEALDKKEKQMANFGAKFLETKDVAKTAYQVKVENPSQGSILANASSNVSEAFTWALKYIYNILKIDDKSKILFELNTDFEYNRMGSDEQNFYINAYTAGAISWLELRNALRRAGTASEDDNEVFKEIQNRLKGANNETETEVKQS